MSWRLASPCRVSPARDSRASAHLFCAVDRVEERRSPEGFGEGLEALDLSGKLVAVNPAERDDPPWVLDREDHAGVVLLGRSPEKREPHQAAGGVGRNLERGRGAGASFLVGFAKMKAGLDSRRLRNEAWKCS
jgi:hypothetical protein